MANRTHHPNPAACIQWEMLLADALDGLLRPEDQALFAAHKSHCPACAALFEEARRGRQWLEFLSPEPEVPAGLLARILAQTGPRQSGQLEGYGLAPAANNVLPMPAPPTLDWQRPGFIPNLRRFSEPRLLMTAAMAFFSIALTLNITGVHLSAVRRADLRPISVNSIPGQARSFFERRLTMASTPVIRYYDHSRLVYEVESKVRELRRATEDSNQQKPSQLSPGESKQTPARTNGATREDSQQQSGNQPAMIDSNEYLQSSLKIQATAPAFRRLQKNTSEAERMHFSSLRNVSGCPTLAASLFLRLGWDSRMPHHKNSENALEKRSTPWTA
jgi:hypothetical protein